MSTCLLDELYVTTHKKVHTKADLSHFFADKRQVLSSFAQTSTLGKQDQGFNGPLKSPYGR